MEICKLYDPIVKPGLEFGWDFTINILAIYSRTLLSAPIYHLHVQCLIENKTTVSSLMLVF